VNLHAFVDESVRDDYVVCAVITSQGDLGSFRRLMLGLRRSGEHRAHMAKEGDSQRKLILNRLRAAGTRARIYVAPAVRRSQRAARDGCFQTVVPDLVSAGVSRLIVESCGQDSRDRRVIADALAKLNGPDDLEYAIRSPRDDPLLWAADALCWAYGRGGQWRVRVTGMIECVTTCDI